MVISNYLLVDSLKKIVANIHNQWKMLAWVETATWSIMEYRGLNHNGTFQQLLSRILGIKKKLMKGMTNKTQSLNIKISINMNRRRWDTSSICIIDWEAPIESNGRMMKGAYISVFSWTSLAASMIWMHKNQSPLTIFTCEKPYHFKGKIKVTKHFLLLTW